MGFHTVEKIGGTSMSRFGELLDNIFIGNRTRTKQDETLATYAAKVEKSDGKVDFSLLSHKTANP